MGQMSRMVETKRTCRFVEIALLSDIHLDWHNGDGKGMELVQDCIKWQYYHFWYLVSYH